MLVGIEGAVEIARIAIEPDWDWSVDALGRFCVIAGWEITDRSGSGNAALRTNLRVGRPESDVYGNPRKTNLISTYVTDVADPDMPGLGDWLADAFDQLRAALADILGEQCRYEPGRKATVAWDRPNMTIDLHITWQAIHMSLVRPDGYFGIDYQE
ncbi:DUF6301 family protein [Nocardia sp. NBC_01503]|uniref:DUF6301 family protein n=1 Tax=Nocardia sp. NBC_01503 TaxID=2975997 RepID=UPI002E7B4A95|nr:DUF6301 family protein [Nocardia sp. NBC_01503]WTL35633.1 DUF6301 family protein [Nocardia sp. NBC_01503]